MYWEMENEDQFQFIPTLLTDEEILELCDYYLPIEGKDDCIIKFRRLHGRHRGFFLLMETTDRQRAVC
jgi:hypothetical protein